MNSQGTSIQSSTPSVEAMGGRPQAHRGKQSGGPTFLQDLLMLLSGTGEGAPGQGGLAIVDPEVKTDEPAPAGDHDTAPDVLAGQQLLGPDPAGTSQLLQPDGADGALVGGNQDPGAHPAGAPDIKGPGGAEGANATAGATPAGLPADSEDLELRSGRLLASAQASDLASVAPKPSGEGGQGSRDAPGIQGAARGAVTGTTVADGRERQVSSSGASERGAKADAAGKAAVVVSSPNVAELSQATRDARWTMQQWAATRATVDLDAAYEASGAGGQSFSQSPEAAAHGLAAGTGTTSPATGDASQAFQVDVGSGLNTQTAQQAEGIGDLAEGVQLPRGLDSSPEDAMTSGSPLRRATVQLEGLNGGELRIGVEVSGLEAHVSFDVASAEDATALSASIDHLRQTLEGEGLTLSQVDIGADTRREARPQDGSEGRADLDRRPVSGRRDLDGSRVQESHGSGAAATQRSGRGRLDIYA